LEDIMLKRSIGATAVAVLVVAGGWLLAQAGPAGAKKADAEVGRYAICPMGATAVMVDTTTSKTWVLHPGAEETSHAWLPAERIDDAQEARKWMIEQTDRLERQRDEDRRRAFDRLRPTEQR
jgi:hypothetical protein